MIKLIITESHFPRSLLSPYIDRRVTIFNIDFPLEFKDIGYIQTYSLWSHAYYMSQNWYIVNKKFDITDVDGISYGKVIEIEVWEYLKFILESVDLLNRIIRFLEPNEIILATYNNKIMMKLVSIVMQAMRRDIKTTFINPSPASLIRKWKDFEFLKTKLKTICLDRFVRLGVLWAAGLPIRLKGIVYNFNKNKQIITQVLAILEQPGSYITDSILPILSYFPNSSILLVDMRHLQRTKLSKSEVLFFSDYVFNLDSIRYAFAAKKIFFQRWRTYENYFFDSHILTYNGLHLWSAIKGWLKKVFTFYFPLIAAEIVAARRLLRERDVQSLLLASDAHHTNRLFTLIANEMGIPSVVIQHGATVAEWGYVPVYATRFAAWGQISRNWLLDKGVSREKIVVTGSPRFDRLVARAYSMSRERFCAKFGISSDSHLILWAMDPISNSENSAVLNGIVDAVEDMSSIFLIIRPHPGMPKKKWVDTAVSKCSKNKRVIISPPTLDLYDTLAAVDAVIVQESTVGLEALILNKPVIVYLPSFGRKTRVPFYVERGAALYATTSGELKHALEKLFNGTALDISNELSVSRQKFLQEYLYAIDGKSSSRVAYLIQGLLNSNTILT